MRLKCGPRTSTMCLDICLDHADHQSSNIKEYVFKPHISHPITAQCTYILDESFVLITCI